MRKILTTLFFFSGLMFVSVTAFGQYAVVDMKDFDPDEIYVRNFSVKQSTPVYIDAVGVMSKSHKWNRWDPMLAYGWILNTDTREIVWAMTPSNVNDVWSSNNVEFKGTVTLKPGNYEAYYSTYGQRIIKISSSKSYLNEFMKNLVKVFVDDADLWEDHADWKFRIMAKDEAKDNFGAYQLPDPKINVVNLTGARDSDYLEKGFTVEKEVKVRIYCIGEGQDGKMYDFGWINNDQTARPVWEMRYENTSHAGGAEKNRVYNGIITLPPGNYIATYMTDDSHSYNDWNMQPPYDPGYWGLSIRVINDGDLSYIHDYKKAKKQEVLSLIKIGDSQYRSEGFSLTKQTDIFIYAIGEGRDHRMYDYAWITDAKTGERVWEMRYYETKYAGGADKNRLFEGSITLMSGDYTVHYVSDGSHSYEDWNDDPPYNAGKWGITLSLVNAADGKNITRYVEAEDRSILSQIVRVGDDEYLSKTFTVKQNAKVRVICLGEGRSGHMYDYGWIKNRNTGQTIWEMTYGMSQHAGGARKNRIYDGVIYLEAGTYEAYYITDGSHSFEDWNDDPPGQPDKWGITIQQLQ